MAVRKKYSHTSKGPALGRGLDALISTDDIQTQGKKLLIRTLNPLVLRATSIYHILSEV